MQAALTQAKAINHQATPRQQQWLDFYAALGQRNFVRAVACARVLGLDEARIQRIQRDALKQFLVEYQNFAGAARLCADYGLTAQEWLSLTTDILKREDLAAQRTFCLWSDLAKHLSVAEQIRGFAHRQFEMLKRQKRRARKDWRKKLGAVVKSWLDQFSHPQQGGFPHDGLAQT